MSLFQLVHQFQRKTNTIITPLFVLYRYCGSPAVINRTLPYYRGGYIDDNKHLLFNGCRFRKLLAIKDIIIEP